MLVHFARLRRVAILIALSPSLLACSHLHLTQDPGVAIIRTGTYDQSPKAGPVAARVLPYALIAEQSYNDDIYAGKPVVPHKRECIEDDPEGCDTATDQRRADHWLNEWRYVWGCSGAGFGRGQCRLTDNVSPLVEGLGVQVWVRRGPVCREAIIAFRGTIPNSLGDWASNLHWITRNLPIYDQYDQVRDHIGDFIGHVTSDRCYREGITQIATLGHSLGGGLAQLAAYEDHRVRRVYAFDPSFVTGYYSVKLAERDNNRVGLRIERIYEHGEILAFARYLLRQFNPPTACDPRIVNVRFHVLHGNIIYQHGITPLTSALLRAARNDVPERDPVIDQPCSVGGDGEGEARM